MIYAKSTFIKRHPTRLYDKLRVYDKCGYGKWGVPTVSLRHSPSQYTYGNNYLRIFFPWNCWRCSAEGTEPCKPRIRKLVCSKDVSPSSAATSCSLPSPSPSQVICSSQIKKKVSRDCTDLIDLNCICIDRLEDSEEPSVAQVFDLNLGQL